MVASQVAIPHLWAKSDAGGQPHSLIGHLLDTAAVAELLWDRFMAPGFRNRVDAAADGRGRALFSLICGFHDLGKATVAFQIKARDLPEPLAAVLLEPAERAGLSIPIAARATFKKWPHPTGSVRIVRQFLADRLNGEAAEQWEWALSLIEGHHGRFGTLSPKLERSAHGAGPWAAVQSQVTELVLQRLEIDITGWKLTTPSRGIQLALAGFVIMADWIASSSFFPGLGMVDVSMDRARLRARTAWDRLRLTGGWDSQSLLTRTSDFPDRFGFSPRPLQSAVLELLHQSESPPGLLVIDAPMGEGKTEAALGAVELLAKAHGANGLTFAMPTQGTTDAMYERIRRWMRSLDEAIPVTLLHGKASLNEHWYEVLEGARVANVSDEQYGLPQTDQAIGHAAVPSSWLLGRHRGLLSRSPSGPSTNCCGRPRGRPSSHCVTLDYPDT